MTNRQNRIMDWYQQSDHHLLVTGPRGSGKTTLVDWFDQSVGPYAGYRSYKSGDITYLSDRLEKTAYPIGKIGRHRMEPVLQGFERATEFLQSLARSDHDLIVLDEVGYMERRVPDFVDAIVRLAKNHRLLIVIRQTEHALENRLTELGRYDVLELSPDEKWLVT